MAADKELLSAKSLKRFSLNPSSSKKKDKCLSLYNMSKAKKQTGRTNEEIEYERAKNELTFTPSIGKCACFINHRRKAISSKKSIFDTKGVEDSVERIRKAREV
eukprot:TRINITY_DN8856_c0_g1_i3.p2 TRINITY_DN8856_c0_g1~~TRINITY_DN8856_c0_g1_i3.p2  ORF type:complete len:104 (-),score=21.49 TRINITY_DN8856_c0_g1_i3:303-614(-)